MSLEVLLLINCNFEKVVASYLRTDVHSFRPTPFRNQLNSETGGLGQYEAWAVEREM
jgi:hypothetical protein